MTAWQRWPIDGVPERPGAWLTTTARRRALDRLRRSALESTKLEQLTAALGEGGPCEPWSNGLDDDQLCLIFTCCHPALSIEARVALTLRAVAGLTTAEIARAFLVTERTMTQRLFRAKRKIRDAAIPFRVPAAGQLSERLESVLAVLYLVFNEGYYASSGAEVSRRALCTEAIRLTRLVLERMPDEPDVAGLGALMELHDARRPARTDANGDIVALDEQDRTLWDRERIDHGVDLLEAALVRCRPGPYQLQAAIAACHATALDAASTDWTRIARLYGQLLVFVPSPIVELNRAVAVAMAEGPLEGLAIVDALIAGGALPDYHLLPATRADLLRRLGRTLEAAASYRDALALVTNEAERRFLERRLRETDGSLR